VDRVVNGCAAKIAAVDRWPDVGLEKGPAKSANFGRELWRSKLAPGHYPVPAAGAGPWSHCGHIPQAFFTFRGGEHVAKSRRQVGKSDLPQV